MTTVEPTWSANHLLWHREWRAPGGMSPREKTKQWQPKPHTQHDQFPNGFEPYVSQLWWNIDEMVIHLEKTKQPKKEGTINSRENKTSVVDCMTVWKYLMLLPWRRIILPCPLMSDLAVWIMVAKEMGSQVNVSLLGRSIGAPSLGLPQGRHLLEAVSGSQSPRCWHSSMNCSWPAADMQGTWEVTLYCCRPPRFLW